MKRHGFDAISFAFGVIFIALAVMLSFERFDLTASGVQLIGAAALLFLGASLLLTSRRRTED